MKRISYLSFDLNSLSIHAIEIIRCLVAEGVAVSLYCADRLPVPRSLSPRCDLQLVKQGGGPYLWRSIRLQAEMAWKLFFANADGRPDLIYARQTFQSLLPVLFSRLCGVPYFAEVNGIVADRRAGTFTGWQHLKQLLEKICLRTVDRVFVPSRFLKSRLMRRYQLPAARITVARNGANTTLFRPVNAKTNPPESGGLPFRVGFVGSMGEWQGIEVLKAAIRQVVSRDREVRFDLVGDYTPDGNHRKMTAGAGDALAEWGHFITRYGLGERVSCSGFVEYERSAECMQGCDLLLAPYTRAYREFGGGSPMKLYAYLACGKPVILSDLGELTDAPALRRHDAAHLIPPDDPQALAEAILAFKCDPEERARLGANGRRFVLRFRQWQNSAQRILEAYAHRWVSTRGKVL